MVRAMPRKPIVPTVSGEQAEEAVRVLLRWAGEDPAREGLRETPARVVRAYRDWFSGYEIDPGEYLRRTFTNVHGHDLRIAAVAIDSGGHHTADVYMFCRGLRHRHVFAVKGASVANRPILSKPTAVDIDYRGTKIKGGGQVWSVGTDTAKELIYGRLKVGVPGPGYMHFDRDTQPEWVEQLTSETVVYRMTMGRRVRLWRPRQTGIRQEGLDCTVYAYAAMVGRGGQVLLQQRAGQAVQVAPKAPDAKPEAAPPVDTFTAPRRPAPMRRSWVRGWRR